MESEVKISPVDVCVCALAHVLMCGSSLILTMCEM